MKRLVCIACAIVTLLTLNVFFPEPADAAGIRSLDANALMGMTSAKLIGQYGYPQRKEPSEYGFTWFVYNRDYANYFMVGVKNDKVVSVYTCAKTMNYRNRIKLNSTKAAVRAVLGNPITYVMSGNTVRILNSRDQRDYFKVGSNFVIVFYDTTVGGKVTSMLIVPQVDQIRALVERPALSQAVVAAYERISVDLINASRVRRGIKRLTADALDTRLAVSRSKDMRDRNYFSHTTPAPDCKTPATQAKSMGIRYSALGENIAFGDHNAIFAHEAFMNSSGHRYNVLRTCYTKVGAGVAYGGNRYVLLTNIFTK